MDATAVSGRWTRVRTLGRGASGAVVSLAADDRSGALFAVKSARAADDQLRREGAILSALCSPHVLPCLGFRASDAGECQLFLEFAPGGTLADVAERQGGRLEECLIRAYAADVARGLAYLHGRSVVHGDIKSRNVVVGADGRAKIADFGCARSVGSGRPVAGTPAFMAPEVARGEEQGPAADVWALGCTVLEMATGRAPWSDMADVLAALHRIGYTDAVPEVPAWLSADAKSFLAACFARDPRDRCTAAQLLEHPFLASAGCGEKPEEAAAAVGKWVSPKSTLDAELWEESDTEEDEEDISESPAERIKALASSSCSGLPDWDSNEGWIDVLNESPESIDAAADKAAGEDEYVPAEECLETEVDFPDAYVEDADRVPTVGSAAARLVEQHKELCSGLVPVFPVSTFCDESEITESLLRQIIILDSIQFLAVAFSLFLPNRCGVTPPDTPLIWRYARTTDHH
ncbi:mitogen-activated protein kinase kinase kinase 18-like [Lolium rigidum]|uniref:mitogen-activated protein kinase kinase kinase 18-like n=1 Tax=Lolium rigidum TaxID=89674 RepID=UPI001F5CA95A|nr:mitogen-activated protein kinase kinase kinase 18-like [Lolium rigidum]